MKTHLKFMLQWPSIYSTIGYDIKTEIMVLTLCSTSDVCFINLIS